MHMFSPLTLHTHSLTRKPHVRLANIHTHTHTHTQTHTLNHTLVHTYTHIHTHTHTHTRTYFIFGLAQRLLGLAQPLDHLLQVGSFAMCFFRNGCRFSVKFALSLLLVGDLGLQCVDSNLRSKRATHTQEQRSESGALCTQATGPRRYSNDITLTECTSRRATTERRRCCSALHVFDERSASFDASETCTGKGSDD
jgi:hypothetical protein